MPEGFLATDAILRLCMNVTFNLHVNDKIVAKAVRDFLPFIATENILMEGVKRGGDRQELHEIIREESMRATELMKNGEPFDLLNALASHTEFGMSAEEFAAVLDPASYIGRCAQQVEQYLGVVDQTLGGTQPADALLSV